MQNTALSTAKYILTIRTTKMCSWVAASWFWCELIYYSVSVSVHQCQYITVRQRQWHRSKRTSQDKMTYNYRLDKTHTVFSTWLLIPITESLSCSCKSWLWNTQHPSFSPTAGLHAPIFGMESHTSGPKWCPTFDANWFNWGYSIYDKWKWFIGHCHDSRAASTEAVLQAADQCISVSAPVTLFQEDISRQNDLQLLIIFDLITARSGEAEYILTFRTTEMCSWVLSEWRRAQVSTALSTALVVHKWQNDWDVCLQCTKNI